AGASRAMLASAVFAFETTLQPLGLLPLIGGCAGAYLVSALLMRHSIMTEKIARRGVRVPAEYHADFLDSVLVRDAAARDVVTLRSDQTLEDARTWISAGGPERGHQGFPVIDGAGIPIGVLTRRTLLDPSLAGTTRLADLIRRPIVVVYDDCTLREAADHMVNHDIGRLPVIRRAAPSTMVGIITRSDLLTAHRRRLREHREPRATIRLFPRRRGSDIPA
ncbi:MAG: CBS domain-containing protein, partial [Tepidisphaeraceae bacterium]